MKAVEEAERQLARVEAWTAAEEGGREEGSSSSGTSGSRIEMHGDKMVLDTKLAERGKEPRNKGQEQEEH